MLEPNSFHTQGNADLTASASELLSNMGDCVLVVDRAWRVIWLNEQGKALLGYARTLVGEDFWRLFPDAPGGTLDAACRYAMAARVQERCERFHPLLGMWLEFCIIPCGEGVVICCRDISARVRQVDAWREGEEQSRQDLAEIEAIYASAPVGLVVLSADLRFLRVNEVMAQIHGYPIAAHLGKTIRELVPGIADAVEPIGRRIRETGEPVRDLLVEGVTAARPGERRCWISQWLPQKDRDGRVTTINVVIDDVTERQRTERALREKAEELRAVLDAVPAAVFLAHDIACRTMSGNRTCEELLRLPPGANPSKSAGDDAPRNFRAFKEGREIAPEDLPVQQAAAAGQAIRGFELELAFDAGDSMHIYGHAAPLFDANGKPRGAVGAFVDVTEVVHARQAEQRRRAELERLVAEQTADRDRLWQLSADLVRVVRYDGVITAVNPAWTAMLGWTEQELVGCNIFSLIHPEDRERSAAAGRRVQQGATVRNFENRYQHKDGSYRWIAWNVVAGDGLVIAIGRDITNEKQKAEALELSAARLRSIFATSYLYQGLLTTDGVLLDANPTSLAGINARLEDVVGKPFWETPWFTGTPGMPEQVVAAVRAAASGEAVRREILVNLPTGWRVFDFSVRPVFDATATVIAIVPEAIELTERRDAEERLRQVQKMEAVGQLAGGIAHDFNNRLAAISGSLDLAQRRLTAGRREDVERHLAAAHEGVQQGAALTHRLLALPPRKADAVPTDLPQVVTGMSDLIRRTVGPQHAVEVATSGIWTTLVDRNEFENALLNLCINARDAMPNGGRLTIETADLWLDGHSVSAVDLQPGPYVVLHVRDTGIGMPPNVAARAFEPFFTTKGPGEGTGLGLAMVYSFARQSGGQASIRSQAGHGTTVSLYLPRHFGEQDRPVTARDAVPLPRAQRGESVLVVDDDPAIRSLIAEILDELGYTVIRASDAARALRKLQSAGPIDLLVTDIGLPGGMNGGQLADAARDLQPGLKVLFITGYGEAAAVSDRTLPAASDLLTKPFAIDALANRVSQAIIGN